MSQIFKDLAKYLLIIWLTLSALTSFTQDKNVDDVQERANELFQAGNYLEAKNLYSQLVSLYPKDENFNYKFGTCLLFVDVDKSYPLKFLEYAVSRPNVDVDAFYFLGKGYHYNYRFDDAIQYFQKYKSKKGSKDVSYPVDDDIRFCNNGKQLMVNITLPLVLSKKKVTTSNFTSSFKLNEMGGRVLFAPKELHSSVDKKKSYVPVMYKNKNSNVIYYSSYGNTDKNGLDIFSVVISDEGIIGKPIRLSDKINTPFDESFPFFTEDTSTFYFSSTGHNSMGGADIFKASFDRTTNVFSDPLNLDYSINTPDDDLMYAEVSADGVAFFASNRNCEKGMTYVYKINAHREEFQIAVLSGVFNSEKTKSCKITVEDLDQHIVVGSYMTDEKSGKYVMQLKNGGKYSFLVEPNGEELAYQGQVELPNQVDLKLLKQEINIVQENGAKRLVIRNLFNEDSQASDKNIIADVLLKNADIDKKKKIETTLSNDEIVSEIESKIDTQEKSIEALQNRKNISFVIANQKRELAHKDLKLADDLDKEISLNDTSSQNRLKQNEFSHLVNAAKEHLKESEIAYEIGLKYEEEIADSQAEFNKAEGYLLRVKETVKNENSRDDLIEIYKKYKSEVVKANETIIEEQLNKSIAKETRAMKIAVKQSINVEAEQKIISEQIKTKKSEILITKKKKEKLELQEDIDRLKTELQPLENEKEGYLLKANELDENIQILESEKQLLSEILDYKSEYEAVNNEEKKAMLASIKATNKEIEALESVILVIPNLESREFIVEKTEGVINSVNVPESTNVVAGNMIDKNDNRQVIDASGNVKIDNELSVNIEREGAVKVADSPLGNKEGKSTDAKITEYNLSENDQNEVSNEFNLVVEYELPAAHMLLIEGQSIPLDITSSTGKLKYTNQELEKESLAMDESSYNALYTEELSSLNDVEELSIKAKESQRINYNWLVAIEKEVAGLKYIKIKNGKANYSSSIDEKINHLEDQASQKRNLLALNARIIKQLNKEEEEAKELVKIDIANSNKMVEINELNAELLVEESELINIDSLYQVEPTKGDEAIDKVNVTLTSKQETENSIKPNVEEEVEGNETALTIQNGNNQSNEINDETSVNSSLVSNESLVNNPETKNSISSSIETETEANETGLITENIIDTGLVTHPVKEIKEFSPLQEAQVSLSAVVLADIEIQKENQIQTLSVKKNEVREIELRLAETKKKKNKRVLEAKLIDLKWQEIYESKKLALVELKMKDVELAQSTLVSDPLGTRHSEEKYLEIKKLNANKIDAQLKLEELQSSLSLTKKKKHEKVIEDQIVDAKSKLALANLNYDLAVESAKEMEKVEEETLKKLTPYGTEVMVELPEQDAVLTRAKFNEVKNNDIYIEYINTKKTSLKEIESATVLYKAVENKKKQIALLDKEINLLNEAVLLLSAKSKSSLNKQILEKEVNKKRLIVQAEVEYKEAKGLENIAYFNLNEANSKLLVIENIEERNLILSALNQKEISFTEFIDTTDVENVDEIPLELTEDIFIDSDSTYYDSSKPIPVDVLLPKGLILKVQIGAFRNPIEPSVFKGFAPIVGEKTSSGLTRYTAGLFKDFETANTAKTGIRSKGYPDAFVVAYLNGKRISLTEARNILSGKLISTELVDDSAKLNNDKDTELSVSVKPVNTKPLLAGQGDIIVEKAQNRGELYFTVQIGVYNNKVQPGSVFTITPLNAETIANNLVRYSTGVYGTISEASLGRNKIIQMGISDAFVTAYYKGKRITIAEAKSLITKNKTTQVSGINDKKTKQVNTPQSEVNVSLNDNIGRFSVAIGPYSGDIPVKQVREILMLSSFGVVVDKNNNATLYKIGSFTNSKEAEAMKIDLEAKGLVNPRVINNEQ